jgi:hypothetical protein
MSVDLVVWDAFHECVEVPHPEGGFVGYVGYWDSEARQQIPEEYRRRAEAIWEEHKPCA